MRERITTRPSWRTCLGSLVVAVSLWTIMLASTVGPDALAQAPPPATPVTSGEAMSASVVSLADLGYQDLTARTADSVVSFRLPVAPGIEPEPGSQFELFFSHSSLLLPERSTMTVSVDGEPAASVYLTPENQQRARLLVTLPAGLPGPGGYEISVAFQMRLTVDACEDPQNPALWATIHADSAMRLSASPLEQPPDLGTLDALFAPEAPNTGRITLVLTENPAPEELEAAGLVALQIGRWAGMNARDPGMDLQFGGVAPVDRPVIMTGTGASLVLEGPWGNLTWADGQFSGPNGVVAPGEGILAMAAGGAPRLLVSGDTAAAALLAARNLVSPEQRALLAGDVATVGSAPAPVSAGLYAWREGAASFAQLGAPLATVTGPGEHVLNFKFSRPPEWMLSDGGALQLALEIAPPVRAETSWVKATVNGGEIGSLALDESRDAGGQYTFALPAGQLNATLDGQPVRDLLLEIRVYLDYPTARCAGIAPGALWATLEPTSAWLLPHDDYQGLDLGRFPAPVLTANGENPSLVVIPDQPTAAELNAALSVLAAIGRWSVHEATATPALVVASAVTAEDQANSDMVLVGEGDRNSVLAAARIAKPDNFANLGQITNEPGANRGVLALVRSPWGSDHALVTVGGDGEGGLDLAASALLKRDLLNQVRGQEVIVNAGLPPRSLDAANPALPPPVALAPYVIVPEKPLLERVPAWQITGGILLAGVLALGIVVAWIRARRWRNQ